MKNIIFCSDGTKCTSKDKSNVFVTYDILKNIENKQVRKYDEGVGNIFGRLLRGVLFGSGVDANIKDGFKFISDEYENGDSIYLFGFSRGAYTVRSLASMISLCRLAPKKSEKNVIDEFFDVYKKNRDEKNFSNLVNSLEAKYNSRKANIEAICVWDTVGAIGRQTRTKDIRKKMRHRYHRMSIYPEVKRFYHAVSLDERRTQYWPHLTIGQLKSEKTKLEEVWFPGVHSDIGNAYEEKILGDITLYWMLSRVSELSIKENFLELLEPLDICGKMNNSEGGIAFSMLQKRDRAVARGSNLHKSVVLRIAGPLKKAHQHREPSGDYMPNALVFANYAATPDFGLKNNYKLVGK